MLKLFEFTANTGQSTFALRKWWRDEKIDRRELIALFPTK